MDKAFTIFDGLITLFGIILCFLIMLNLISNNDSQDKIIEDLTITENYITKNSGNTLTLFENTTTKTALANTLKDYNEYIYIENNCNEKNIIPRVIIYENEIKKISFVFCK